jgi:hypothetical protein
MLGASAGMPSAARSAAAASRSATGVPVPSATSSNACAAVCPSGMVTLACTWLVGSCSICSADAALICFRSVYVPGWNTTSLPERTTAW